MRSSPPFREEVGHGRRESQVVTQPARRTMTGRPAPSSKSARCCTIRLPWRALGLGLPAIGGIAAAYYSQPMVGEAIVICGTVSAVITMATALFGSETTSERAFRLLRWLANRPEPDAPPTQIARVARRSSRPRSGSLSEGDTGSNSRLPHPRRSTREEQS
jgi:hypothetical protein